VDGWFESYRGAVNATDCDVNEHMNVASYLSRASMADRTLLSRLGLMSGRPRAHPEILDNRVAVQFTDEFRAGDVLHIESAVTGMKSDHLSVRHLVRNSASGAVATTIDEIIQFEDCADAAGNSTAATVAATTILKVYAEPAGDDGFEDSALDIVYPRDLDPAGVASRGYLVSKFSDATLQTLASIGITRELRMSRGYSFSTFEFQLAHATPLRVGAQLRIRSAIRHVGSSSIRILHRMSDGETGQTVAELSQFGVCLDMASRRSTPLPDDVRKLAQHRLVV
jgi:acyl-CoA thioester hydrolase